jgi:hypothetical protein
MKLRNLSEASDYRDDAAAVGNSTGAIIEYRAMDFEQPGVRKVISSVIAHLQMRYTDITSATFEAATNLDSTYLSIGSLTITKGTDKIESIKFSLARKKSEYLQIKITSTTKDESFILAGLDFGVGYISEKGFTERSEST